VVDENLTILLAAESGSRAWGFASPDSDYDVRFIYIRPRGYYLRLEKRRDVCEWILDEMLDINGWNFNKTLQLMQSSDQSKKPGCVLNDIFLRALGITGSV